VEIGHNTQDCVV